MPANRTNPKSLIDHSDRAAFTVGEWITGVVPMSRGFFYTEVKAGRIRVVKRGSRTYVPAGEGQRYIDSVLPRGAGPSQENTKTIVTPTATAAIAKRNGAERIS